MNDKKLWTVFSQFIRLRDSDENGYCKCITCGRRKYWREVDCGHGIPRQHMATKYHEKNNNAQCKACNGFQGGKRELYKIAIDKKFGLQTWDLIELASRSVNKWTQFEVDALTEHYKREVDRLKSSKNLQEAA